MLENSFSSLQAENLLLYNIFDQNYNLILNTQYFNETKVSFYDMRCDALMMSPTDLGTLSKYIVEYSFLFHCYKKC